MTALDYAPPWTSVILTFKSPDGVDRAPALASLLAGAVGASASASQIDGVLPVPSSPERLAQRGFNPAWELARRVATRLGLRGDPWTLQRPLNTPSQQGHRRDERAQGVQGAFVVDPRRASAWHGKHVALVDDVLTTGATASQAARTLLAAGVARVDLWVLARTPPPAPIKDPAPC